MLKVIVILAIVLVIVDIAITVFKKLDFTTEKEKLKEFDEWWDYITKDDGEDKE